MVGLDVAGGFVAVVELVTTGDFVAAVGLATAGGFVAGFSAVTFAALAGSTMLGFESFASAGGLGREAVADTVSTTIGFSVVAGAIGFGAGGVALDAFVETAVGVVEAVTEVAGIFAGAFVAGGSAVATAAGRGQR